MRCTETTKAGKPCRAYALKGKQHCPAHDPDQPESTRFGSPTQAAEAAKLAGRPRLPRPHEVYREKIEAEADEWLRVLVDARDAETTKFFGPAGEQFAEVMPDHQTRLAAFREAHDRVYGKPKQQTEITGADGGPIVTEQALDLTRLSDEELEQWRALQAKARP